MTDKVKKIIDHMVYMYQMGQVNREDYENYKLLAEGYKTGIEDAVEQMIDEFPELKEFGEAALKELEVLDNCLCNTPFRYLKLHSKKGTRTVCADCFRKTGLLKTVPIQVQSVNCLP